MAEKSRDLVEINGLLKESGTRLWRLLILQRIYDIIQSRQWKINLLKLASWLGE